MRGAIAPLPGVDAVRRRQHLNGVYPKLDEVRRNKLRHVERDKIGVRHPRFHKRSSVPKGADSAIEFVGSRRIGPGGRQFVDDQFRLLAGSVAKSASTGSPVSPFGSRVTSLPPKNPITDAG